MRWHHISLVSVAAFGMGCLDSTEPPDRSPTAEVRIPTRLYVVDREAADGDCPSLFVATSTQPADVMAGLDGTPVPSDDSTAINCFVDLETPNDPILEVEQHEVTNLQYQLCVDSGACGGPDPSDLDKAEVCESDGSFDECPIVDVSTAEANEFCEWVGRRLPTTFEYIMIRQANVATMGSNFPTTYPLLPSGDQLPTSCDDAVVANGGCDLPFPVLRGSNIGAAPGDILQISDASRGSGEIYDLVGNVAELVADLEPNDRGDTARSLPWFCATSLSPPRNGTEYTIDDPPICPANVACVRARYRPGPTMPIRDDYPFCLATRQPAGLISGSAPILVGASFFETLQENVGTVDPGATTIDARGSSGMFGRRVLTGTDADEIDGTPFGRRIGFRCVGSRPSALEGPVPDFEDQLSIVTSDQETM